MMPIHTLRLTTTPARGTRSLTGLRRWLTRRMKGIDVPVTAICSRMKKSQISPPIRGRVEMTKYSRPPQPMTIISSEANNTPRCSPSEPRADVADDPSRLS